MDNGTVVDFFRGALLTAGLVILALVPNGAQAQSAPTQIEQMGELAAGIQDTIETNRGLINSMREHEELLSEQLNQAIDSGLNLSNAIINKQLETLFIKLRAEQFERLQKIKGSADRIKNSHKVYTLVKDIVDDTNKQGTGTAVLGASLNILATTSKNPFIANARSVRKLSELGVITIFDVPRRQEVLAEFREEVRRAELRDLELTERLVENLREIRTGLTVEGPRRLDLWGVQLQDAAVRDPKRVAALGAELDSFERGFDKAISVGGLMRPIVSVKASLIPVARRAHEAVSEATRELNALRQRDNALGQEALAALAIISREDRDLRDQIDAAQQRVSALFDEIRRTGLERPEISKGQVNFLKGPAYTNRGELVKALDALQALIDELPNAIAQRQTRRAQQAGGNVVLVNMAIDMGRTQRLAADPLTQRMTGVPHAVPFVVMGRHQIDSRRDCRFQVQVRDELVERIRSQRFFDSGPSFGIRPQLSGTRFTKVHDGIVSMIQGREIGTDRVVATARALVDFTQRPTVTGDSATTCRDFLPRMDDITDEVRIDVVKITDVEMVLESSIRADGNMLDQDRDLDAFISLDDDVSALRTGFRMDLISVELTAPDGVSRIGRGTPLSFSGVGDFNAAQDGTGVAFTALRPGSGTYTVFIEDDLGDRYFEKTLDLTANGIGMEVEPLTAAAEFFDPVIDLVTQNAVRIIVDGPARMSGYRVRWSADNGVQVTTPLARFRSQGGVSVASTSLTATDLAEATGKRYNVTAELLSPDGVILARGSKEVVASIVGNDLRLVAKDTNVGIAAKDIFIPARRNDFGQFGVQVLTGGPRIEAPLRFFDARVIGNGFLRFDGDTLRASFDALGGGADTSTRDTGNFVARVAPQEVSPGSSPRFILPPRRSNSDSAFVTVNKLNVKQREGGNGIQTVLEVFGPADMASYRARFVLRDGGTIDGTFEKGDAAAEAVAEVAPDAVRAAQVIAQGGRVLGEFRLGDDGPVLGPPQFTFRIPNTAAPGQSVVIFANVLNVPFDDAGDFDCRWQADPAFGTFDRSFVTLAPVSGNAGLCVNTLTIADDPQLIGREAPIEVELIRIVGDVSREEGAQ
ncbi:MULTISPECIES: hypothetical protein [unclassified Minwuia]|uniref:hypothetical protein n=1 Tax=unclassified Minwuia TaxID=2618799 RepID=UPI00247894FA|nr:MULTISPECIES: hypothetical protein [unclassified Minwuia]